MDILYVIIFVQSFVWSALLLKQSSQRNNWLGIAFLSVCLVYLLKYLHFIFGINISEKTMGIGTALTFLLLNFYQVSKSLKHYPKTVVATWWILIALFVATSILSLTRITQQTLLIYFIIFFGGSFFFDGYIFMQKLENKLYSNSVFRDGRIKLDFLILLSKFVVIIYALVLTSIKHSVNQHILITNSFQIIICILLFIDGFIAVTLLFEKESQLRKRSPLNTNDNSELIGKINKLMTEQKVYLDCELTLGKMADLLQTNEHELTTVLNGQMNTNFYKLINDYRIKTIKQKLQEPNSRNFTIMASAYESGFNSKSTFYRIFKEYTNMTPKEYITKNNNR